LGRGHAAAAAAAVEPGRHYTGKIYGRRHRTRGPLHFAGAPGILAVDAGLGKIHQLEGRKAQAGGFGEADDEPAALHQGMGHFFQDLPGLFGGEIHQDIAADD